MKKKIIARELIYYTNRHLVGLDKIFWKRDGELPAGPIFIIGVPRSGTTLTYQVLAQYFQVAYFPEFFNYFYGIPTLLFRLCKSFLSSPENSFESNFGKTKGFFSPAELGSFLRRWFPEYGYRDKNNFNKAVNLDQYKELVAIINSCQRIGKKPLLIKTLYLNFYLDIIAELFPNSYFVHVERNMLDVCQSFYNKRSKINDSSQWWSIRPPHYKDLLSLPLWQQCVEHACSIEDGILTGLKAIDSERIFTLSYYNLCNSPLEMCKEMTERFDFEKLTDHKHCTIPELFQYRSKQTVPDDIYIQMKQKLLQKGYRYNG